jgi:polar amino acid transport system substrate-binding protein
MRKPAIPASALVALLALALALAACGSGPDKAAPSAQSAASPFKTRTAGVLTVGSELPNPPFLLGDSLRDLKGGYEYDMVNEVAKRLSIPKVVWVNFPFNGLVAGAPCPCDFDVNGVSIFPDRKQKVDFSSPYFTANQGVLVRKGTAVADAAAARTLRFGVQKDSSGGFFLDNTLKPEQQARVYDSTTAAFLALNAKQIDAVMSDVPIVLDGAKKNPRFEVVGQFTTDEQYGAVLPKGSPNTKVLSEVIDKLRAEGYFDQLLKKYFPEQVQIPVLR